MTLTITARNELAQLPLTARPIPTIYARQFDATTFTSCYNFRVFRLPIFAPTPPMLQNVPFSSIIAPGKNEPKLPSPSLLPLCFCALCGSLLYSRHTQCPKMPGFARFCPTQYAPEKTNPPQ